MRSWPRAPNGPECWPIKPWMRSKTWWVWCGLINSVGERLRSFFDIAPQPIGDRAMRDLTPPRRDDFGRPTSKLFAGDVDEALLAQILLDDKFRHVSPSHALQD